MGSRRGWPRDQLSFPRSRNRNAIKPKPQLELECDLAVTLMVRRLMKIIVCAVKIATKYNCGSCSKRRLMINDESVAAKTKYKIQFLIEQTETEKTKKNKI